MAQVDEGIRKKHHIGVQDLAGWHMKLLGCFVGTTGAWGNRPGISHFVVPTMGIKDSHHV